MARKARRDTYSFIELPPVKNGQDGLGEAEGVTSPKKCRRRYVAKEVSKALRR
jgi:hypothetical protein